MCDSRQEFVDLSKEYEKSHGIINDEKKVPDYIKFSQTLKVCYMMISTVDIFREDFLLSTGGRILDKDNLCEECGFQLIQTGDILESYPPQTIHQCLSCGDSKYVTFK
jgi:hypothetical protein